MALAPHGLPLSRGLPPVSLPLTSYSSLPSGPLSLSPWLPLSRAPPQARWPELPRLQLRPTSPSASTTSKQRLPPLCSLFLLLLHISSAYCSWPPSSRPVHLLQQRHQAPPAPPLAFLTSTTSHACCSLPVLVLRPAPSSTSPSPPRCCSPRRQPRRRQRPHLAAPPLAHGPLPLPLFVKPSRQPKSSQLLLLSLAAAVLLLPPLRVRFVVPLPKTLLCTAKIDDRRTPKMEPCTPTFPMCTTTSSTSATSSTSRRRTCPTYNVRPFRKADSSLL
ncbi:hypothetical protein BRADI_4g11133v3 [Brachypodium distachyon]|uniref:Uncharacterized protein n=1 Tax=Brachypodium distachyon TaxID=15368 RepID=A0A0Q3EMA3_BRADI|nr:hypothetical protein BRADI_4g11133v3 [Brachypodium distachyon]